MAQGVNAMRSPDRAMLVVTHYQRLLNYIVPDCVHVLVDGRIVRSGGPELALELEEKGYATTESERAQRRSDSGLKQCELHRVRTEHWRQQVRHCKITRKLSADSKSPRQAASLPGCASCAQDAFARFCEAGFPTTRDEDWRFTNVSAIAQTHFQLEPQRPSPALSRSRLDALPIPGAACQLVFVDGRFAPSFRRSAKLAGKA